MRNRGGVSAGIWAGRLAGAMLLTLPACGAARAESGSLFKNLFSGGSDGSPAITAPRAYDPEEAYCPAVTVNEGAVVRAFAGAAGDNTRLRHQIVFGQISRECTAQANGSIRVKVGVELRAMLGPAGSPGRFDAPLSIALAYGGAVLSARSRRVGVVVPAGTAQGRAAVIEADMIVPAGKTIGYDITVSLGGRVPAARVSAGKRGKPAAEAASAEAPGPVQ